MFVRTSIEAYMSVSYDNRGLFGYAPTPNVTISHTIRAYILERERKQYMIS